MRKIFYLLLDKPDLKFLKQHSHTLFNTDFNYLYSYVDNYNGIEIYVYDIESHKMTIKSYRPNHRILDSIKNIVKISKSRLLISGIIAEYSKGFTMDLGSKNLRQIFQSKAQTGSFHELNKFFCYENYLLVFGCKGMSDFDFSYYFIIFFFFRLAKMKSIISKKYCIKKINIYRFLIYTLKIFAWNFVL
ncbi:unnamed protein product [Blepharisma stoltei]|uniref:Uncharacterized protein n=1 Tax=Blepharisma stoltei TaxID=1481888 RepID=A0AAU9KS93_9CILI|nr:unnamed protein product [Blepharisma stoltei]